MSLFPPFRLSKPNKFNIRGVLANYEKFLIIIGSPRSGSTLLSQLINGHPSMLCASEAGIERICSQDNNQTSLYEIIEESYSLYSSSFSKSTRFGKTLKQYQAKWIDPVFPAKDSNIRVCGDKGLYRIIAAFNENPETIVNAMKMLRNVHLILTVRDPLEISISALKSHSHQFETIHQSLEFCLKAYDLCEKFIDHFGYPTMVCSYEDLIVSTEETLKQITSFLEVSSNSEWLRACESATSNSSKMMAKLCNSSRLSKKCMRIEYSNKYLKCYDIVD